MHGNGHENGLSCVIGNKIRSLNSNRTVIDYSSIVSPNDRFPSKFSVWFISHITNSNTKPLNNTFESIILVQFIYHSIGNKTPIATQTKTKKKSLKNKSYLCAISKMDGFYIWNSFK